MFEITGIAFSMLSAEEERHKSVCTVLKDSTNDRSVNNGPGGLYDRLMGPITATEPCGKCKKLLKDCYGHFGRIELALPIINPVPPLSEFLVKMLSCFCNCEITDPHTGEIRLCMKPLFSDSLVDKFINFKSKDKCTLIAKSSHRACTEYGIAHKQREWLYTRPNDNRTGNNDPWRILIKDPDNPSETPQIFPTGELLHMMKFIERDALTSLGLKTLTPEKLIKQLVLVLGNPERLPTAGEGASHSPHHDFTKLYGIVIAENNILLEKRNKDYGIFIATSTDERLRELYKDEAYARLCNAVYHLFINKDNACRDNSGGVAKGQTSLLEAADGKGGLMRGEILASRGPNAARTVIVPDPYIASNEIGVPETIMNTLTKEIDVTEFNLEHVRKLAREKKVVGIKGDPERTRRGDESINQKLVPTIPEDVLVYRSIIRELGKNKGDKKYGARQDQDEGVEEDKELTGEDNQIIMAEMGITQEELENIEREDLRLKDEEQTRRIKISESIESIKVGDKIIRNLIDGDIGIMSRQPLLRKESCMGHRVREVKGNAFRLNPTVCASYNADFDGDEMNLYIPQSYEAEAEVYALMAVERNGVSDQGNRPLISIIQDALLGMSLLTMMTKQKVNIEGETVEREVELVPQVELGLWQLCIESVRGNQTANEFSKRIESFKRRCRKYGVNPYSGRGMVSFLFPENYAFDAKGSFNDVRIRYGILWGTLDSKTLGATGGSIYHNLFLSRGPHVAMEFLTNSQRMSIRWLKQYGFTVSYKDITVSKEGAAAIEKRRAELLEALKTTARGGETSGPLVERESAVERQKIEADTLTASNNLISQLSETVLKYVDRNSPLYLMAKIGTKGSTTSLTQMLGIVGQITIQQERPKATLSDRRRRDTHFPEDYPGGEAAGLCDTSYREELGPSAILAQGQATRQAAFDISERTAQSGYLQRKLAMCLSNIAAKGDGSARLANSSGKTSGLIIQFLYGGDGLDGSRLIRREGRGRFIDPINVIQQAKLDLTLANREKEGIFLPPNTKHFLTKYDRVKIITERSEALRLGAKPYPLSDGAALPPSIALYAAAELEGGFLTSQISLTRRLPSGESKEVMLEEQVATDASQYNG